MRSVREADQAGCRSERVWLQRLNSCHHSTLRVSGASTAKSQPRRLGIKVLLTAAESLAKTGSSGRLWVVAADASTKEPTQNRPPRQWTPNQGPGPRWPPKQPLLKMAPPSDVLPSIGASLAPFYQ